MDDLEATDEGNPSNPHLRRATIAFRIAAVALGVVVLLDLSTAIFIYVDHTTAYTGRGTGLMQAWWWLETHQNVTGIPYHGGRATALICFFVWLNQSYKSVAHIHDRPKIGKLATSSMLWFFVPIANLYKGYDVVKRLYRLSDPGASRGSASTLPLFNLVSIWWMLFWIAQIIYASLHTQPPQSDGRLLWSEIALVVEIGTAAACIAMMRRVVDWQMSGNARKDVEKVFE